MIADGDVYENVEIGSKDDDMDINELKFLLEKLPFYKESLELKHVALAEEIHLYLENAYIFLLLSICLRNTNTYFMLVGSAIQVLQRKLDDWMAESELNTIKNIIHRKQNFRSIYS